jgi:hypothetical protein
MLFRIEALLKMITREIYTTRNVTYIEELMLFLFVTSESNKINYTYFPIHVPSTQNFCHPHKTSSISKPGRVATATFLQKSVIKPLSPGSGHITDVGLYLKPGTITHVFHP